MKKETPKRDSKNLKKNLSLTSLLKKFGFILPTSAEEIEDYDNLFIKTDVILPAEVDSPDFLFVDDPDLKKADDKPTLEDKPVLRSVNSIGNTIPMNAPIKSDYFKKLVLAAEIANQLHNEPTFGHKKFVKVYYLCEQICNMKLSTNYGEYAAGPLDPKNMYTIDAQFKNRKWFVIERRKNSYGFKYLPGENLDQYKQWFPRYFGKQVDLIERVINLFRKESSDFCEIVATVYFIWNKTIMNGEVINNSILVQRFYDWGDEKKKFSKERLEKAIEWMRKEKIVPLSE
jgi:hypothetical protein